MQNLLSAVIPTEAQVPHLLIRKLEASEQNLEMGFDYPAQNK